MDLCVSPHTSRNLGFRFQISTFQNLNLCFRFVWCQPGFSCCRCPCCLIVGVLMCVWGGAKRVVGGRGANYLKGLPFLTPNPIPPEAPTTTTPFQTNPPELCMTCFVLGARVVLGMGMGRKRGPWCTSKVGLNSLPCPPTWGSMDNHQPPPPTSLVRSLPLWSHVVPYLSPSW